MITVEDIKNMTNNDLEHLADLTQNELKKRENAAIHDAWRDFFDAANRLLSLNETIKVDWDDPYEDDLITINCLSQFCRYREDKE